MVQSQPITGLPTGEVPERVLVVGDPSRVELVSQRLEGSRTLSSNREYVSVVGSHKGTDMAVISHGVGTAGAAICFEELIRAGATKLIRAGTAGGLQPTINDGDLVIAAAAIRDDGVTRGLVPIEYPAVAHHGLVVALSESAPRSRPTHVGTVLTSDVFYPGQVLGSNLQLWQRAGAIAVEMECAALFVIASLSGVAAGAILAVDGNPLASNDADMDSYDPDRAIVTDAVASMIDTALDALTV